MITRPPSEQPESTPKGETLMKSWRKYDHLPGRIYLFYWLYKKYIKSLFTNPPPIQWYHRYLGPCTQGMITRASKASCFTADTSRLRLEREMEAELIVIEQRFSLAVVSSNKWSIVPYGMTMQVRKVGQVCKARKRRQKS